MFEQWRKIRKQVDRQMTAEPTNPDEWLRRHYKRKAKKYAIESLVFGCACGASASAAGLFAVTAMQEGHHAGYYLASAALWSASMYALYRASNLTRDLRNMISKQLRYREQAERELFQMHGSLTEQFVENCTLKQLLAGAGEDGDGVYGASSPMHFRRMH